MRLPAIVLVSFLLVPAALGAAGAPVFDTLSVLDTQAPGNAGLEWSTDIDTDGKGQWVAVWHSTNTLGERIGRDWDILFSRSPDNGVTWSAPEPVNTNAATDAGKDRSPVVVNYGVGHWLVVWTSADAVGKRFGLDSDILYSRSTDGGKTWSAPEPVNTNAASDYGDDADAWAASDGKGNWLVVWTSTGTLRNTIGGDRDILYARSADNGHTWTAPAALNTNAADDSGFDISPRVTTDGDGHWVVVWSSGDSLDDTIGSDRDLLTAHSSDDGRTWSPPAPLNTNAATDSRSDWSPSVATDTKGTWVAVWSSADTLGETLGMDRDILLARSADLGATWSPPAPLNRGATTDSREDSSPEIVADQMGNWVTVWHSWASFNQAMDVDADIYLAHSSDRGLSWSEPSTVNPGAAADEGDDVLPHVATDGRGWVAVWQGFEVSGNKIGGFEWDILASTGKAGGGD